jgi:hypothetical protein
VLGAVAQAAPFYASKDGSMVWDEDPGLVWARCSLGQKWTGKTCAGDASKHTFEDALATAALFNAVGGLGGAKDWTVPAIRQLVSLRSCSTGPIGDLRDLLAWFVNLSVGSADYDFNRSNQYAVRVV